MKRWPTKPLSEVAECLDGRRIPITAEDRAQGDVPYYGANGQVGWIDKPIFNESLLLIAEDGGHFDQPEKGVAYLISGPSWVNNHAHVIRSDSSQVSLEFLGHYFRHFNFMPFVNGTTRAKLNQKALMSIPVPVPPLAEQEQIVQLLNEADALRKLRAQADRRTTALLPAIFHEMFGDPATNPKGWPVVTVGEVAEAAWGNTSITKASYTETGFPAFSATGCDGFLPQYEHDGDGIVVSAIGARCGKCFFALGKWTAIKNTLTITNPKPDKLDLRYMFQIANDESFWPNRGGAQPFIGLGAARRCIIPLPPLPLQQEFAQQVAEIHELEAGQAVSRHRLDDLFQSLLHRAFAGEL